MITSLYNKYFQKSRSFLFPALGIAKSVHPPLQTYISLNDVINPTDGKLLLFFQHTSTVAIDKFEKEVLFSNPFYEDSEVNEDEPSIYVFNLELFKDDWEKFLKGKYSQLSPELKLAIKRYYGEKSAEYAYMDTFLHPEKYYPVYADLLGETEHTLQEVGELCDPFDPVKERLLFSTKKLGKLENKSIHL